MCRSSCSSLVCVMSDKICDARSPCHGSRLNQGGVVADHAGHLVAV